MTDLAIAPSREAPRGPARPDLAGWHPSSWVGPLVVSGLTFALWLSALAVGVLIPHWWARLALVAPLTLLSGQLFTLGHDAAHGSLSTSRTVNAVVGRLAFVPSVHVFGLWRFHHDLHHRFTNLRDRDFIWTPLTVDEFRGLSRPRRWLHRLERHRSGLGLGLHYALEIWVPRMLWPRRRHYVPDRRRVVVDALVLYGTLAGLAGIALGVVAAGDAGRVGDIGSWASAALFLFVLPLIGTQWLIGFVIYLNHTHPDVVWFDDVDEWARHDVQLEGTAAQRFRRLGPPLPRRIMSHTAHHVDPGVPLSALRAAQQQLVDRYGDRIVHWDWSRRRFHSILSSCKLYDYDAQRWLTYDAVGETT